MQHKTRLLSHYLDLIKSCIKKQDFNTAKRYGEMALKKLPVLSYTPFEECLFYCRIGEAYNRSAEYSRSLDIFYKANLIASKNRLDPSYIAYTAYMMGSNLVSLRNIDRALYQFQKVEEFYKEHKEGMFPMDKMTYFIMLVAIGYCNLGDDDLWKLDLILKDKIYPLLGTLNDETDYGYYYHLQGEYFTGVKKYDEARQSFQNYIGVYEKLKDNPDQILEGRFHIATIDLLEGKLDDAIQSLISIQKEAKREELIDIVCQSGLLLSKCYILKNMPSKSIAIEKAIKPLVNKLDIIWLYEQTREFEKLYRRLQPIYQFDIKPVPDILKNTINQHYGLTYFSRTIIGQSPKIMEIYQIVEKIAPTDLPVLIQGETGTGKELVAQAIHRNGLRKGNPWLALNCSAIPEPLLENELFGHDKGAFTDAKENKKGYIELASGGTLFLDEIGNMPAEMQKKLLRVLEEKIIWRVGAQQSIPVDTRFVFASNQDIEELVKKKGFRMDLFHRINPIIINLPPLRERKEDIPFLLNHFLAKYFRHSSIVPRISAEVLTFLQAYSWPGNVRELENEVERICALNPKLKEITAAHLSEHIKKFSSSGKGETIKELTDEFHKKIIEDALRKNQGKIIKTAQQLGLSRIALYKKMKYFNISVSGITKK